jgi:hypothetical protein
LSVWDKPAASLPLYEKAARLSPQDPHIWTFHHMRGVALYRLDRLEEAEDFVRAAVRQQYATYWPFATLCALLAERGRIEEAAADGIPARARCRKRTGHQHTSDTRQVNSDVAYSSPQQRD